MSDYDPFDPASEKFEADIHLRGQRVRNPQASHEYCEDCGRLLRFCICDEPPQETLRWVRP
jgi:hypothetical protein